MEYPAAVVVEFPVEVVGPVDELVDVSALALAVVELVDACEVEDVSTASMMLAITRKMQIAILNMVIL